MDCQALHKSLSTAMTCKTMLTRKTTCCLFKQEGRSSKHSLWESILQHRQNFGTIHPRVHKQAVGKAYPSCFLWHGGDRWIAGALVDSDDPVTTLIPLLPLAQLSSPFSTQSGWNYQPQPNLRISISHKRRMYKSTPSSQLPYYQE